MSNRTKKARKNALSEAAGVQSASNKHITRISAKPAAERTEVKDPEHTTQTNDTVAENVLNSELVTAPTASPASESKVSPKKGEQSDKSLKKAFILFRPFVAFGRYLRDSWREIRQVRWPNRSSAWKMTAAVLAYCAVFIVFIMLLDTLFTFLFNLLIK